MKRLFFFITFCILSSVTNAQKVAEYDNLIEIADSLYKVKEFKHAAETYSKAAQILDDKKHTNDRYNAACSWSLAHYSDSAFVQLYAITKNGAYTNYNHLATDTDFDFIHKDKKWNEILLLAKEAKDKADAKLNKPLVAILDGILFEDQYYRKKVDSIDTKYGWESKEMKAIWKIINEKDSINLIKVTQILDKYGWLGADVVGNDGNQALFLVIQHADINIQQKYLPMMREAAKKGNARASSLALLEDRVALGIGKRQTYGSQIGRDKTGNYYVSPLEDPDNVDKRRAEVGLRPLSEYVRHWNIKWDVEAYKKQLPELEKTHQEPK